MLYCKTKHFCGRIYLHLLPPKTKRGRRKSVETEPLTMRNVLATFILCLCGAMFFASCVGTTLERAFTTKMESRESNKTISEYCATCHTHKNFEPSSHLKQSRASNEGVTECRTCHTYTKTWLLDVRRKTLRTADQ